MTHSRSVDSWRHLVVLSVLVTGLACVTSKSITGQESSDTDTNTGNKYDIDDVIKRQLLDSDKNTFVPLNSSSSDEIDDSSADANGYENMALKGPSNGHLETMETNDEDTIKIKAIRKFKPTTGVFFLSMALVCLGCIVVGIVTAVADRANDSAHEEAALATTPDIRRKRTVKQNVRRKFKKLKTRPKDRKAYQRSNTGAAPSAPPLELLTLDDRKARTVIGGSTVSGSPLY
ncbi:hypothetical protein HDE_04187 [Halotydeus destructor]|nr:hypothetical protein HDE_04187 [Halotydeus destructor]